MKILMALTSHDQLGDTGKRTGFWLEEFAAPIADYDAVCASKTTSLRMASTACSTSGRAGR